MTRSEDKAYKQGRMEGFAEAQSAAEDAIREWVARHPVVADDDGDYPDWATEFAAAQVRDAVVAAIQKAGGTFYDVTQLTIKAMGPF